MIQMEKTISVFSRSMVGQHFVAAISVIVLFFGGLLLLSLDRRPPVIPVEGQILPVPVIPGRPAKIVWENNWVRQCEGVVSREVVGPDRVIRPYMSYRSRIPNKLGYQTSETIFTMPLASPPGEHMYRATIRFYDCGVTSWLVPIEVDVPVIYFDVSSPINNK